MSAHSAVGIMADDASEKSVRKRLLPNKTNELSHVHVNVNALAVNEKDAKFLQALNEQLDFFVSRLKRGELQGSTVVASQTVQLLRAIISRKKFRTVDECIELIQLVGRTLVDAKPTELTVGNIVRRVLCIIRTEAATLMKEELENVEFEDTTSSNGTSNTISNNNNSNNNNHNNSHDSPKRLTPSPNSRPQHTSNPSISSSQAPVLKKSVSSVQLENLSLSNLLNQSLSIHDKQTNSQATPSTPISASKTFTPSTSALASTTSPASPTPAYPSSDQYHLSPSALSRLKPALMEELSMLMEEIRVSEVGIADQAIEHIYAKEVILTCGCSPTVIAFLKQAGEGNFRQFEVFIAESAPSYVGHRAAMLLSSAPVPISTTLVSDNAVFALMSSVNKVIIGTKAVMANGGLIAGVGTRNLAVAAKHHSVPVVVLAGMHKLSPLFPFDQDTFQELRSPQQLIDYQDACIDDVDVLNPAYDYIEPELVTLFITNVGGHNPSYIYRLLQEYYHPQDYGL